MAAKAPDFFVWTTSGELGEAVLVARKAAGLTQAALAARSGVTARFVYSLERGKGTLRNDKTLAVLRALGLFPLIVPLEALGVLR